MSVLIRGMEMPTEVDPDNYIELACGINGKQYARLYNICYGGGLTEWCEIIPVPEPHGRLIDADALITRMNELVRQAETDGFDLGTAWYTAFIRHIELAPTIIPAEEGET